METQTLIYLFIFLLFVLSFTIGFQIGKYMQINKIIKKQLLSFLHWLYDEIHPADAHKIINKYLKHKKF